MVRQDSKTINECWRYEYPDGGGPWFLPNGLPRNPENIPKFEEGSDVLYGCNTIENLNDYMKYHNVDTSNMNLVHYIDIDVISYRKGTGHIAFRLKEKSDDTIRL